MKRTLTAVLAPLAAVTFYATSADAVTLPFQQNTGFFQGVGPAAPCVPTTGAPCTATVVGSGGGAPVAGFGGLDFFNQIAYPSSADATPRSAYHQLEWGGMNADGPPVTPLANNGVETVGATGWGTPGYSYAVRDGRSSLEVQGLKGTLDGTFQDISVLQHHNHPIMSNGMSSVTISSWFQLGTAGVLVDGSAPTTVGVNFVETPNGGACTVGPAGGPVNPLGSACDDFAIIDGLDFADRNVPANSLGRGEPAVDSVVQFQLFAAAGDPNALVCPGSNLKPGQTQDARCGGYAGSSILIYTGEDADNHFSIQARIIPATVANPVALFVVGDCERGDGNHLREVGDAVNFWGAQWWKNNCMSGFVSHGVAAFKGYATNAGSLCGQEWQARPGNSGHPPATIPNPVTIIVTDTVVKSGPNISGKIKQLLLVDHDGRYGPNPGHRGNGTVKQVLCTAK